MTSSPRRLGVVMDALSSIKPHKDSTVAMLREAARRGWAVEYMQAADLALRDGRAEAMCRRLHVREDVTAWCQVEDPRRLPLAELDVILMRSDPPVDLAYIAATWVLDRADAEGTLVVNRPQALRDANEKIAATWFPDCCPASLVTCSIAALREFLAEQQRIVVKPLDAMGGRSVFVVAAGDPNANVILEDMTRRGQRAVMAQRFLEEVAVTGDKRILLIDGEPLPQAMIRLPAAGELRANMAVGGRVEAATLDARDRVICAQLGPVLRERGLRFVGIDVIGGYLTEINVTSPTGIVEIERLSGVNAAASLFDALEGTLAR